MARVSALSGLVSALCLALVFTRLGPDLAMGLAIYGGNTEPARPSLPFPAWELGAALLLSGGLLGASAKWPQLSWAALLLSLVGLAVDVRYLLALAAAT